MRIAWMVPGLSALLLATSLPAADISTAEAVWLANTPGDANVQAPADAAAIPADERAEPEPPAEAEAAAPTPVAEFDLERYSGAWYVIASIPDRFYGSCASEATVTYTLEPDQRLRAESRCRSGEGGVQLSKSMLRIRQPGSLASRLQMRHAPDWLSWLPQTWNELWVVDLAPDYRYAVEATPDREQVTILSRSPRLDKESYDGIVRGLRQQGFTVERLRHMPQQGGSATSAEEGVAPPAP